MVRFLGRLLNVRPAEWPRLGWLYVMLLVSLIGTVWGETIVEAAFLRQVGVQYLPLVISASAVLQIAGISVYMAFADRVVDDHLLLWMVGISAAAIVVGLLFLVQGLIFWAYPLLYLAATVVLRFMLSVHWTTYVNGFYDTRTAKRIVPLLGSAARFAGIIGGFTMPILTAQVAPAGIILLWLLALLVMMALIWSMPRVLKDAEGDRVRPAAAHQGPLTSIRDGYRFVASSGYMRWLTVATFLMMVLLAYLNYEGGKIMLAELGTVQGIANFTGLLNGLSNLVILPFQVFLLGRLIGSIGLGNAQLLFPGTTALSSAGLLVVPGLGTAALAYLNRTTLRTSIFSAIDSLLYNAVPLRLRGRARAFISGLVVPIGTLCGGLLLSLWSELTLHAPRAPFVVWFWPILLSAAALGYLVSAWSVRRRYAQALVTMLEQDDLSFLVQPPALDITLADPAAGKYLQERLGRPGLAPDMAVFLAQLSMRAGGPTALSGVYEAAQTATDGGLRARLVEVLATADSQDGAAWTCLAAFLDDHDSRVCRAALAGLARLPDAASRCEELAGMAEALLSAQDFAVRLQALTVLTGLPGFVSRPAAAAELKHLLADPAPGARCQGVTLLGQIVLKSADSEVLALLLAALADKDDRVRLAAALALEEIGCAQPLWLPRIAPAFGTCIHDPVERVRAAAVCMLGRDGSPAARPYLFEALADPSLSIRQAAVDGLALGGAAVLPEAQRRLNCGDADMAPMAAVLLIRLAPRQFRPVLLKTYVDGVLQRIYGSYGAAVALAGYRNLRGAALLRALLDEQNQVRLDECFFLLSPLCPPEALQTVRGALSNRERGRRAGAAEALEALTSQQLARLLALWCDPERTDDQLRNLAEATWGLTWPSPDNAFATLSAGTHDPWLRAAVRYAYCEVAAAAGAGSTELLSAGKPPAEEEKMLAIVERVIFLKEVSFFQDMTVEQLQTLAEACEEEFFPADARIFNQGDAGGILYVVVSGRVALEQEKRRGSFARVATVEGGSYFGEMNLFDNSPRTTCALAVQDTILLRLERDPLIALARRYPDLSLALVNVLSVRLRKAQDRIAELTRTRPEALHKLYDELG